MTQTRLFNAPLLYPAAALISGIAAGRCFTCFPYAASAVSLAGVLSFILLARLPLRQRLAAAVFYIAGFTAFFLYGPGATSPLEPLLDKGPVPITGRVVRPPEEKDGYTLIFLAPDPAHAGVAAASFFDRRGVVRLTVKGTGLGISYGDILQGRLRLNPPRGFKNPGAFDWGGYARLNGVDATSHARPEEIVRLGNRAGPFLARLYSFRQRVIELSRTSIHDPAASSIFRAIVLGDQGGVTDEVRDVFSASGTAHILSVSGSHVALLAGLIFFLIKWSFLLLPARIALPLSLRLDYRKAAAAAAIPASIMYCLLAGSEVATVRSIIMITVFLAGLLLDREADLVNVLAASVLAAVIWDPSSVFDISFQLSYCAVLFLALAKNLRPSHGGDEVPLSLWRRIPGRALAFVIPSVAVIIGTAPLVARQFNSFSYVSLPANIVVVPLAGFLAVPVGLLSCVLHAVSPGGTLPLAGLNESILKTFYALAGFFASAPSANLHPGAPGLPHVMLFYAAVASLFLWQSGAARKGAAALLCMAVFTAAGSLPQDRPDGLRVTFLDVGQGDSALVEFPGGQRMLIDGGGSVKGIDPGRATVAPYLWNHGIRELNYVVLTHPHTDHMDGLFYITENFRVGQVWEGGQTEYTEDYKFFHDTIERKKIQRYVLTGSGEMAVGGAMLQVLHAPSGDGVAAGKDKLARENDGSLVLRIKYGEVSFLLTGDIGRDTEESLLGASPPLPLRSTVMKVPHHGSRGSSSEGFFNAVSPRFAVISVGRGNIFRLPSPETVAALTEAGAKVFRTDMDGAVTFVTDGSGLEVCTYEGSALRKAAGWDEELQNYRRVFM